MRCLTLALSLIVLACATTPRHEIQSRYDGLAAAFEREDLEGVLSFRTADFHAIGPDGRHLDYAQMADYARGWFELNEPPIVSKFTILDVEMRGRDEAAVTVLQQASRRQQRDGKLRTVEHSVVQRETWVRGPGGWKIRMVDQVRDQKRWVDGKRVD